MESNYSLTDLATITNGANAGGNSFWIIILFILIFGWNGMGGRGTGDYGQYATSASQQEILFNQKFSDLDNKMDRGFTSIGNGISSATFSLNNSIKDGNAAVAGAVVSEGRALSAQLADSTCTTQRAIDNVKYEAAMNTASINATTTAQTQKILDAICGNRMADMQNQINALQLQAAMCGVVRYPNASTYCAGAVNFSQPCGCNRGCGCGNV